MIKPSKIISVIEKHLMVKGIKSNDSSTEVVKARIVSVAIITMYYPVASNKWIGKMLNQKEGVIKFCSKRFIECESGSDLYSKTVMTDFKSCIDIIEKLKG